MPKYISKKSILGVKNYKQEVLYNYFLNRKQKDSFDFSLVFLINRSSYDYVGW